MGNLLSKKHDTKYKRLEESVWGYKGVNSTINGLFLSSIPDGKGGFITKLFRQDENGNRVTVWVRITSVKPTAIEIFYHENERLRVVFMIGEEHAGIDDVVWETNDFKFNDKHNKLVSLTKKNKKSSSSQSANGAGASAGGPEVFPDATYPNGLPVDISRQVASGDVFPFRRPVLNVKPNEDVSPLNGPQIEVSEQVRFGQGVSTVSQTDGSLEVHSAQFDPSVVFERDIDTGASALQADVQRLLVDSQVSGGGNSAFKDVKSHQPFAECGLPPSLKNASGPVQVTQFFGKDATFSVSEDGKSIHYVNTNRKTGTVSLGIVKDTIKKIEVYQNSFGIYLILIHATDGIVHVCGYTNKRTAKSLTSFPVNQYFSQSAKHIFEKIEFCPPKTADDGSELQGRNFKLVFSNSLVKTFNINFNGELNQIPNV